MTQTNKTENSESVRSHLDCVVMRSSMVVTHFGKKYHTVCADRNCTANPDNLIPHYYSWQHAKDEGWNYTKDIMFCPPDVDGVWVCPNCSKGYFSA